MKKTFKIFTVDIKEICTPNHDYYSRSGDWNSDGIEFLTPCSEEFDTLEEAEKELSTYESFDKFVILTIYSRKGNSFTQK